ncbi:PREDICTED: taste receptor type 2 member 40-like [Nanorana parkeri]|uniref:taste receptor type 2 member 40-like n=1 Tax=Nanorana parkeri TaxID=125878 RepID=UPI0008540DB0|nr:PREDICTED: taste receptor type 2 member 40-like [Nanorana parkeri]
MLPIFVLVSMTVLSVSTLMGSISNSIIIAVNVIDKVKGKLLSPSDTIVVTMGISNVFFQFIMLANDFLSFLENDLYYSERVYILFSVTINLPIYISFWFTACLSINYYFQIVIFTHPFLIRLKDAVSKHIPQLIMVSVMVSIATCLPVIWYTNINKQDLNMTGNLTVEATFPELDMAYLIISSLVSCSLPLVLAGIADGLIIRSLINNRSDKTAKGDMSARAEGRIRAARTISCLLFIYISFYISELLMFTEVFPPTSPGFCVCLMVIYTYAPAQSVVLIFGSPKLKYAALRIFRCLLSIHEEESKNATVSCIDVNNQKTSQSSEG